MSARTGWTGKKRWERPAERRPGRLLAVFKALVLLGLVGVTAYGMLDGGLYGDDRWLPVAAGLLALLGITVLVGGFYRDVPVEGWVLVGLLAVLVGIKGLSMTWTLSETETVKELLRSAMYLATFIVALGALSSGRQVAPLVDAAILIVVAVAGYGLLQKISPLEYPVASLDGVRVDSTVGYANTAAMVIGVGAALALSRMNRPANPLLRGLYAAMLLGFFVAMLLTISRGGIFSLGVGVAVLLILASGRLQMIANLLLVSAPAAWIFWRMRDLEGLWRAGASDRQKVTDGIAFRDDLIVALAAAFLLQAGYSLLVNRYELTELSRKALASVVVAGVVLAAGIGLFVAVDRYGGVGQTFDALANNPNQTENAAARLASLSIGFREDYWRVAWDAWKERPLTGTGAGTFQYTWLKDRPEPTGVKQVHNLYLEQLTETGLVAFLALAGFCGLLVGWVARAAWRAPPSEERRQLLAGLLAAVSVYLVSSFLEWHWYIPASTLLFFILAAMALKFAVRADWGEPETAAPGKAPR